MRQALKMLVIYVITKGYVSYCRLYVGWSLFVLEFYYYFFYIYSWDILEAWCLHVDTQSPIKGIDIEGCKIPMAWAIKQKEHKAVKQHSEPTICLGKDNES